MEITREQLYSDLYIAYYQAIRHKAYKPYVQLYDLDLERNLRELVEELYNRRYRPGSSTCFIVRHPKQREVFAADFRDRIVHHYIFLKTHVLFEHTFIADSYSCIQGRGTHYGIERLRHHIESCSQNYTLPCYVLKMDIKGYFMHIDRELLADITCRTLRKMASRPSDTLGKRWCEVLDINFLCYLCREVIRHDPTTDCIIHGTERDWIGLPDSKSMFKVETGFGMPIGNLTSQLFSNVFLGELDQYMKRVLHCKHYGRYVDDFYVVSTDRRLLHHVAHEADTYLRDTLHLSTNKGKTQICDVRYGVEFLGAFIKPYRTYISNQSMRRIRQQLPHLRNKRPEEVFNTVNSFLGILSHYDSYHMRRELVESLDITQARAISTEDYKKLIRWV